MPSAFFCRTRSSPPGPNPTDAPSAIPSSTPLSRCACSALSTNWKKCRRTAVAWRWICRHSKDRSRRWAWSRFARSALARCDRGVPPADGRAPPSLTTLPVPAELGSLLGYVCYPIAEIELGVKIFAGNGGSVGRDADSGIQGHARWNLGTHLPQRLCEFDGAAGRRPNKGFDPVTKRIAAPPDHDSIIRDAVREALLCRRVPDCAQREQPSVVGVKERDTVPANVVALSNDVSTVAGYSRGLAEGVGTEK